MTARAGSVGDRSTSSSAALGALIDDLAARMQAGEPVDIDAVLAEHPEQADELRQLLPALQLLADVASSGERRGVSPPVDETLSTSGTLGDFRLIREVGRGGMGVVYEAEQISLGRRVALKVLPFAATMDPRQLQRFHNEARAAASLHHEHIVPVFGVGCERGVHYYAMQFIDGTTLAAAIGEIEEAKKVHHGGTEDTEKKQITAPFHSPCSPCLRGKEFFRRIAELIADAADALEHAHSTGVVHRDVKPGNLMVDAAGKLWVTDFGLARFGADAGLTMTGDLIGTLRYMAPEQALAKHGLVDHRADVYGLGATLYELLTGKPAVGGEDKQEILRRIAFEEPVAPRKLDRAIPAELETIALKCLAKNPAERYVTAGELAADLRRWLGDQPIRARRPTMRQRFGRWARRHPALVAALGLVAGVLLAAAWAWDRNLKRAETAALGVATEADQLLARDRLPEALAVAQRAADLLPQFAGDPALRRAVLERVDDLQFLNRLQQIQFEQANHRMSGTLRPTNGDDPAFRRALADFGVDLFGGDEPSVIEAFRRRPAASDIGSALINVELSKGESDRLRKLVSALDNDPRQLVSRVFHVMSFGLSPTSQLYTDATRQLVKELETDPPRSALTVALAWQFVLAHQFAVAERLLLAGQRRFPDDVWINNLLGHMYSHQILPRRANDAVRFFGAALALRPHSPVIWVEMGQSLAAAGRYEQSAAALRRAIALDPTSADAFNELGRTLAENGDFAEAEAAFRQAISLRPNHHKYYWEYGEMLIRQKRLSDAEELYGGAPQLPVPYGGGSREMYRRLGQVLQLQGRFAEAADAFTLAWEWHNRYQSRLTEQEVDDAQRIAELAPRLPAFIAGTAQPTDVNDWVIFASACRATRRNAAAARAFAAAFTAKPSLAVELDSYRYEAGTAAALAGCEFGGDTANLGDAERAGMRRQALDWLAGELTARRMLLEKAANSLPLWKTLPVWNRYGRWNYGNTELACVREPMALARLPEDERRAWQRFWTDFTAYDARFVEIGSHMGDLQRAAKGRGAGNEPPKP